MEFGGKIWNEDSNRTQDLFLLNVHSTLKAMATVHIGKGTE
jgi:hypothetical protein